MVLRNRVVEHNVAMFQSFLLLYASEEGQVEASSMSNSAVMVNNLAERVDECQLKQGIVGVQLGPRKLSVI